jgi:hypothetical protein
LNFCTYACLIISVTAFLGSNGIIETVPHGKIFYTHA